MKFLGKFLDMKNDFNIFENKVRLRTSEELEVRKHEFLKLCSIFEKLNIRYLLHGGVLLGAVRQNDFIPWDWDVEFSVFSEEIIEKKKLLKSEIIKFGFTIIQYNEKLSNFKIDIKGKLSEKITFYSILAWTHDKKNNFFYRKNYKIPEHYIINMSKIKFFDKFHYAPFPVSDYLTYTYGNWKKPLQTFNKNEYLTVNFSGTNALKNFIKKNIIKIIFFIIKKIKSI